MLGKDGPLGFVFNPVLYQNFYHSSFRLEVISVTVV